MLRKTSAFLLVFILLLPLCATALAAESPSQAAGSPLTEPELRRIITTAYDAHRERHTFQTAMMSNGLSPVSLTVVSKIGAPDSLMDCMEASMDPWLDLPVDSETILLESKDVVWGMIDLSSLLLNYRLINESLRPLLSDIDTADGWLVQREMSDGSTLTIVPFRFLDASGASLDGKVYVMYCRFAEDTFTSWACADDDLTYSMLKPVAPQNGGLDADAPIVEWIAAYESAHPDEQITTVTQTAAQRGYTGMVTVVSSGTVNIRAGSNTETRAIGRAQPGEQFDTMGQEKNGWYAVVLSGDRIGYISPKMVDFEAY